MDEVHALINEVTELVPDAFKTECSREVVYARRVAQMSCMHL